MQNLSFWEGIFMKLLQLKYFQTICKYNNITRASNELHVSQPSLSNVIRDLEEEFGVTLFQRLSKGLSLTEEGKVLLATLTKCLHAPMIWWKR